MSSRGGERSVDSLPVGARDHRRGRSARSGQIPRERGSALMLVLFACLTLAVGVQVLSMVTLCAERAMDDEQTGRVRLSEKDAMLAALRQRLLADWQLVPATWWPAPEVGGAPTQGMAVDVPGSDGWLMRASARQEPAYSASTVSATVERGRDGIDLPTAAVVTGVLTASPVRESTWVDGEEVDAGGGSSLPVSGIPCYVCDPPMDPLLGPACGLEPLAAAWRLDPGWLALGSALENATEGALPAERSAAFPHANVGDRTYWLGGMSTGGHLGSVALPSECVGAGPDAWVLVVATGGADLDARNRGDLYGVIVVDDGSVLLDGTVLHGAVFATGEVALGQTGQILFSREILRWATDRSLQRVRLVPGTRWEGLE